MTENRHSSPNNVVDLTLSDEDGTATLVKKRAVSPTMSSQENAATKRCCQQFSTTAAVTHIRSLNLNEAEEDDEDDEIEILEGDAIPGKYAFAASKNNAAQSSVTNGDDADLVVVGTKNQIRLPHVRLYFHFV